MASRLNRCDIDWSIRIHFIIKQHKLDCVFKTDFESPNKKLNPMSALLNRSWLIPFVKSELDSIVRDQDVQTIMSISDRINWCNQNGRFQLIKVHLLIFIDLTIEPFHSYRNMVGCGTSMGL